MRETLFNWLGQDLSGWRGAVQVQLVEQDAALIVQLKRIKEQLKAETAQVTRGGAGGYIYLEAPRAWSEEQLAPLGLTLYRDLKAGAVHAQLLQRGAGDATAA